MESQRRPNDLLAAAAVLIIALACAVALFVLVHHPASSQALPEPTASPKAGPLVISRGGVYHGTWVSGDPDIPAVLVKTTEPVTLEGCTLRGRGDLIATGVDHANITIRNTRGTGVNPGVAGRTPGRFFTGESCDAVVIENNDLTHTAGIYFLSYGGDFKPPHTFKVLRNRARNMDGRKSDGHGGWLDFNTRTPRAGGPAENGFVEVQFVALDKVRHVPGIEIAWNEVINDPGESRVEDNINIYLSSGTVKNPIQIHDNFIRGAYTIDPAKSDIHDSRFDYDWQFSGGGILLGDGNPDSPENAPAFVEAYDNQVIDTSNYGIAIEVGHDSVFHDNRILSAGLLPDGRPIAAQNVGAGIWDGHHGADRSPPTFFNNSGRGNIIGWVKGKGRNDWWTPDAKAWKANRRWPGQVTPEAQEAEWVRWNEKVRKRRLVLGSRPE
ncbi:MAG TPA: hypothetical protein VFC78_18070 [Tepidisphaeraceae bacterium]|nr:hypothetical protein [Tepidisphaeraceae bacterium]